MTSFPYTLFLISIVTFHISCGGSPSAGLTDKGSHETCNSVVFGNTFYAYVQSDGRQVGSIYIEESIGLLILEFRNSGSSGNRVILTIQEIGVTEEKGGSWGPKYLGTKITRDYYTDYYADPVRYYGKYEACMEIGGIRLIGTIQQEEGFSPLLIDIVLPDAFIIKNNEVYAVSDSTEYCFNIKLERSSKERYFCSTMSYFVDQIIDRYEKSTGKKMSSRRKKELIGK